MSDPGSTSFPPGQKQPEPPSQRASANKKTRGRIVEAPRDIRETKVPQNIRGEVIAHNKDGSITVRTDHGDIKVEVQQNTPQPPVEQKVIVQIKPDTQTLTLQPEQAVQTHRPQQQKQQFHQQPELQTGYTQSTARHVSTPIQVDIKQTTSTSTQTAISSAPLQNIAALITLETPVKLIPIQSSSINALKTQTLSVIQTDLITTTFNAPVSLPPITAEIQAQALQSPITTIPLSGPPQYNAFPAQETVSFFVDRPSLPSMPLQVFQLATPNVTPTAPQTINTPTIFSAARPDISVFLTQPTENSLIFTPPLSAPQIIQGTFDALPVTSPLFNGITNRLPHINLDQGPDRFITAGQKAEAIPAIIIGQTEDQEPIVQVLRSDLTTQDSYILKTPVERITPGTPISITPHPASNQQVQISTPAPTTLPQMLTPMMWQSLSEIQTTLAGTNSILAQNIAMLMPTPSTPAQLVPMAMFFMSALRGGDFSSWLGDKAIETLRRAEKGNLLSRLGQEGNILSRLNAEPVSQDWRGMALPIQLDNEVHRITLHYKHDNASHGEENSKDNNTRFVFDLTLPNMGKVQLDGLLQPERLDLILRTEEPFSGAAQETMRQLYQDALQQTTIGGALSFQDNPESWVVITPTHELDNLRV